MTGPTGTLGTDREVRLGPLVDIPVGEGRAYPAGGLQVAVFRLRNGELRATAALCPHAGGPLADGTLDDCVVMCPLHANAYELDGGAARGGGEPVAVYPVREDAGEVVVTLP